MPSRNPMIRVPPELHARLQQHADRLLTAVIAGQSSAPVEQDVVPLHRVIEVLLDHYEAWQTRKAASRRERRSRPRLVKAGENEEGTIDPRHLPSQEE